jgi:hypothetical protein
MKEQTKTLLKVGVVLIVPALFFIMGIAVGSADVEVQVKEVVKEVEVVREVPVIEERVVVEEKIVYQDTKETTELVDLYHASMLTTTEAYVTIFEAAEECMGIYGYPIHNDYYTVYEFAKEYKGF